MSILFYLEVFFGIVFSVFLIINNAGLLSFFALILGAAFSIWFGFAAVSFLKNTTEKKLYILRKIAEYAPFFFIACFVISRAKIYGEREVMDAVLALYWLALIIFNRVILYRLNDKRARKYFPQLPELDPKHKHSIFFEILEWVDAIVQAACVVLLFTVFVFQLYVIPSESMVPQFMVGDRVAGIKFLSGPTFPLSSFRFPQLHKYERGDVVIIRNPHYKNEPNNELKFFTSQLVQYLTLTTVNINKDENGNVKADPLVKRIVGLPGEKIMLVDGVLYIKKAGEKDFKSFDESGYAAWNLSELSKSQLEYVRDAEKMTTEKLNRLQSVETWRKQVDFSEAEKEADVLIEKMKKIKGKADTVFSANDFLPKGQYLINYMAKDNEIIASKILTTDGGLTWFKAFLKNWQPETDKNFSQYNLYEKRNAQLNVLIKLAFGKLFVRNAELYKENATAERFASDEERTNIIGELEEYLFYLSLTSQRNMNEFPQAEEEYIPEGCYFMMGDNRFNSLDMRHEYSYHLESLNSNDAFSIVFITNIKPRYIPSSKMLGTVNLILFPFSRFGRIK